jgi:hypothetical protein
MENPRCLQVFDIKQMDVSQTTANSTPPMIADSNLIEMQKVLFSKIMGKIIDENSETNAAFKRRRTSKQALVDNGWRLCLL